MHSYIFTLFRNSSVKAFSDVGLREITDTGNVGKSSNSWLSLVDCLCVQPGFSGSAGFSQISSFSI